MNRAGPPTTPAVGDEAVRAALPPLRCAIIGMGQRGTYLAGLAASFPGVEITWLVDISGERIAEAATNLHLGSAKTSTDAKAAFEDPEVDAAFVLVPDHQHQPLAEAALVAGKHVFLEKPIATTPAAVRAILQAWQRSGRVLQLGYVLRDAPFFRTVREEIRSGVLGPVRYIALSEQMSQVRGASFLRRWHGRSSQSGGLVVHKGCHDLDLICWLLDDRPRRVISLGGRNAFVRTAPAEFCSECPERLICPYVDRGDYERRTAAERAAPSRYGLDRCVFSAERDIVDNQLVAFELDSGIRGTYHLALFGPELSERRISIIGDRGRLDGIFEKSRYEVSLIGGERRVAEIEVEFSSGHQGGDGHLLERFFQACRANNARSTDSVAEILRGMVFAFAAQTALREHRPIDLGTADFHIG